MSDELVASVAHGGFEYDPDKFPKHVILMGGWRLNDPPSREEYLDNWSDEFRSYIQAIIECIEREGMVGWTGECADKSDVHFEFEDGHKVSFSWRAWGDLMNAVVDEREGYIAYYM